MSYSIQVLLDRPLLSLTYDTIAAAQSRSLADEEETYRPGVIELDARIIVDVVRPVKVGALTARFHSMQLLEDHEESQAGSVELFSQDLVLLESASGAVPHVLAPGRHQYSAQFLVPSWLPPTFSSETSRVTHRVTSQLTQANIMSYLLLPFAPLKRAGNKVAVQEVVLLREPPMTLNALRYWSGQRQSAATSVAIKTTRFARVNGRLKISMRVKSLEQLHSCKLDIVQDEACRIELPDSCEWHDLPGSTTETQQAMHLPFLTQSTKGTTYTKRKFPMPTITTAFPEPENPLDQETQDAATTTATLSTLSLEFPVLGHGIQARYESPMLSISHKLRIRIRFYKASVKEIVVNIPITLFHGSASCDDIPPYYEEIYSDSHGMTNRRRTDSVATLPLYTPKEEQPEIVVPVSHEQGLQQQQQQQQVLPSCLTSRCASPAAHDWLDADNNMRPPAIAV